MLNRLFGKKKKRRLNLFLILIPFIVLILVFTFFGYKSIKEMLGSEVVEEKNYIESMNYTLRSNATDYQETIFEELTDAVEDGTDESAIAGLVAKNFISDYFTWTNKTGSYDIGGACYVFSSSIRNFINEGRDDFYKYVSYYQNKYGKENLLEVSNVEVSEVYYDGEYADKDGDTYESYKVICTWSYKENGFDSKTDYMNSAHVVVVKHNGRFEIVSFYED